MIETQERINELESTVLVIVSLITRRKGNIDEQKQYQRWLSLRLSGFPSPTKEQSESAEDSLEKVKEFITKIILNRLSGLSR